MDNTITLEDILCTECVSGVIITRMGAITEGHSCTSCDGSGNIISAAKLIMESYETIYKTYWN